MPKAYAEEKMASPKVVSRKLDIYMQKNEMWPIYTTLPKT